MPLIEDDTSKTQDDKLHKKTTFKINDHKKEEE
jgi:hypothetical protein